ncbi:MAG TPA: nitrate- and nitrite sensing domain-containing protein [Amycolatopsis sp.]|uniref:sensor histidine kinase n=1 Tax=Amycolatopsis sp. TaxID=37632 RepID=UPI002B47DCA0|nr:nitrate- and nitrite sensing domain-containing protein [Amycolatopsis sp.]HKS46552.1 nitrate- and nitrite sensing domain-containing protein [Amycolatopsis sp.]
MSARHHSTSGRAIGSLFRPSTIRWKLIRIMLLSLATALMLLGAGIAGSVGTAQAASRLSAAVRLNVEVQNLIHQLQRERGLSTGLLGGNTQYRSSVDTQRVQTDIALTSLHQQVDSSTVEGSDTVRAALGGLGRLGSVRGGVDYDRAGRQETFQFYTDSIAALNEPDLGFDQAQDPVLRRNLLALRALGDAKEYTGQERGFVNGVFAAGKFSGTEYQQFMEIRANKQAALDEFARQATPDQQARLTAALTSPTAAVAAGYETTAVGGGAGALPAHIDSAAWWNSMTKVIDDERTVQLTVGDDSVAQANRISGGATAELVGLLVLAALVAAAEVALVIAAARSITRPLAALAREADQVADRRLPDAVTKVHDAAEAPPTPAPLELPDQAGTEIRLVAEAFDRVQRTAFELAGEQALLRQNTAESLSNLGRRNQNLVRRQLGLISEFEEKELDPDALAKLFRLDHLATRMRRNAESLLVLVGEPSPRRVEDPVPITDIIRAALSEVEEYRRVVLRRVGEVHVVGTFATELTHMLAELVENALSFSPPGVEVEVYGRELPPGYLLAVVDHGVGMSPEALATANARLSGEERFLIAPTRFLGHYVVGRLAQRLGVDVKLFESPSSGITARMSLPEGMLVRQAPEPRQAKAQAPEPRDPEPVAAPAEPSRVNMFKPVMTMPNGNGGAQNTRGNGHGNGHPPEPGRTRNGLVKRIRKAVPPPVPQHDPLAHEEPVPEARSPEAVRSMLGNFRAGHERGRQRAQVTNPAASSGDTAPTPPLGTRPQTTPSNGGTAPTPPLGTRPPAPFSWPQEEIP